MQVVAFTGLPGSGKTDAVDEARRRGLPIIVMGDYVRAEAKSRGLSAVDENLGKTAQEMRKQFGADIMARKTIETIRARHTDAVIVVVDGVRSLDEIKTLRAQLGTRFHLVAIEAPEASRYDRLRGRGRSDDSTSDANMRARDEREKSWGLAEAIAHAESRIDNSGTLERFRKDVSALFDRLTASAARGSATGSPPPA